MFGVVRGDSERICRRWLEVRDALAGRVGQREHDPGQSGVLGLECLDRIYLNGYVPNLQVGGQVAVLMRDHLGLKIPSPAVFERIGTKFRRAVGSYAEANHIPVVRFTNDDRKIDVMRPHLEVAARTGRSEVATIGIAQEYAVVFTGIPQGGSKALVTLLWVPHQRV